MMISYGTTTVGTVVTAVLCGGDLIGRKCVAGGSSERAELAAVGTWQQELLLFRLPSLQPLLSENLGEVFSFCHMILCALLSCFLLISDQRPMADACINRPLRCLQQRNIYHQADVHQDPESAHMLKQNAVASW